MRTLTPALSALLVTQAVANADLQLVINTDTETFFFEGTYTADAALTGVNNAFAMNWILFPPGANELGTTGGAIQATSLLSIAQSNPSAPLIGGLLEILSNGAGADSLELTLEWPLGDPGTVTLTPSGLTTSYLALDPGAKAIFERSIGGTLMPTGAFSGPGIPIVPAPGALALFAGAGLFASRRRR